jgi:hypothetical protein
MIKAMTAAAWFRLQPEAVQRVPVGLPAPRLGTVWYARCRGLEGSKEGSGCRDLRRTSQMASVFHPTELVIGVVLASDGFFSHRRRETCEVPKAGKMNDEFDPICSFLPGQLLVC